MEWKKAIKCWKYIFKDWGVGSTWGQQCRGLQRCSRSLWRSPSSSFGPASTKVAPGGIDMDPAPFEKVTFIGFSFWRFFQKCFLNWCLSLVRRQFLQCRSYRLLVNKWFQTFPTKPHSASSGKVSLETQQMIQDFRHKTIFRFFCHRTTLCIFRKIS